MSEIDNTLKNYKYSLIRINNDFLVLIVKSNTTGNLIYKYKSEVNSDFIDGLIIQSELMETDAKGWTPTWGIYEVKDEATNFLGYRDEIVEAHQRALDIVQAIVVVDRNSTALIDALNQNTEGNDNGFSKTDLGGNGAQD